MALPSRDSASAGPLSAQEAAAGVAQKCQFITFTLGAGEYGVDIMKVREIKGWSATTRIPNAPAHVRGVINLRGVIIPIFDLNARFGMGLTDPTKMHVVIIVHTGERTVGLLVDTVSDIISVEPGAIRPVPEMGTAGDDHFLEGLVPLEDRMVTLVSLAGLFRDKEGAAGFGGELGAAVTAPRARGAEAVPSKLVGRAR